MLRSIVQARWRELIVIIKSYIFIVELLDDHFHKITVSRVCYLATVIALASEIPQRIERQLVWVLVYEDLQLHGTDSKVGLGKLVFDAPSKRSELHSFLNQGMVEAKTEK
jgi:hypothetical protein